MNEDAKIAVIGMGCMAPGAENLGEFWKVLVNVEDHVQDIPLKKFNVKTISDSDPDNPYNNVKKKLAL